jgi:hypothetical protein
VAVGVLTRSRNSSRFRALESTWLGQFGEAEVFESHTDVSRVQQIWKYLPQRLHSRFPSADFYLIVDDDVFINARRLHDFIARRSSSEVAIFGPGFCDWGVKRALKARIADALPGVRLPRFVHIVIGGIMLFTSAAVEAFSDATLLMQCIDDLETLYSRGVRLWDGLKAAAMYNQDWLFCWCLQTRMGGTVYLDNAFGTLREP